MKVQDVTQEYQWLIDRLMFERIDEVVGLFDVDEDGRGIIVAAEGPTIETTPQLIHIRW